MSSDVNFDGRMTVAKPPESDGGKEAPHQSAPGSTTGCVSCGATFIVAQRFCHVCGRRLDGSTPLAQPEPHHAPAASRSAAEPSGSAARPAEPNRRTRNTARNTRTGGDAERRLVTVLFADISGFTAVSELLDPEEVREIMNVCFEDVVSVVTRYGGTVDKFIGDAVMVLFGAPNAHEDDAERAVAAALEMRQALNAVSERLAARLPQPLTLHVGINSGLVVAGRVGSSERADYTVLGDTVNLAARLEDHSESGQILVSATTHKMTEHAFHYEALPPVRVKGKREPVSVYLLKGARARRRETRGVPGTATPFIGRVTELGVLDSALASLRLGNGALVTVAGPAGAGKSRLLRELRQTAERRGLRWVQAGTSSLGQGGALAVWSAVVRRLLAPPGATLVGSPSIAFRLDGDVAAAEPKRAVSLAESLGDLLPASERAGLERLDDSAVRGRLFLAVRDLLEREARAAPLVVALEDLHWADAASFDLLSFVTAITPRIPLLILATYRSDATMMPALTPDRDADPQSPRRHVALAPLSAAECRVLAEAVLGTSPPLAPVRDLLVEQAEGNPLYLEEILRALADQGAIRRTPAGWELGGANVEAVLPPSLQGLLLDRIDRLDEVSKRFLQVAAVAGRQFPLALVTAVSGEADDTAGRVEELIRAAFLERSESTGNLRFQHALLQEAAYSSLLLRHRRSYHRRLAEQLEAKPELWSAPAELPVVLMHHWERAEVWANAAEWALRAADGARRAYAPADAARLYTRALAAAEQEEPASAATHLRAALAGLGDAALMADDGEEALVFFERALALESPPLERAGLERRRGQALACIGMPAGALAAYERAADDLPPAAPGEEEANTIQSERACLRIQVAFAQLSRGEITLAREAAEAALRLHPAEGDEADALRLLGEVERRGGDPAAAVARFRSALAIVERIGDLPRTAKTVEQLGLAQLAAGEAEAGPMALRQALTQFRRLGDESGCARCLDALGAQAADRGALADAITLLREALAAAEHGGDQTLAGQIALRLGRVLGRRGAWNEALAMLERAGRDDHETAGYAALEGSLLLLARGGDPEAELIAALEGALSVGRAEAVERARIGLATLYRRGRRWDQARAQLRAVLAEAGSGTTEAAITALAGLAQVSVAEGNATAALSVAGRALALAEEHGPAGALWFAQRVHAGALAAGGANREAEAELRSVVDAARQAGALPELAAALSAWAQARRALADPSGAADALTELRKVAQALA